MMLQASGQDVPLLPAENAGVSLLAKFFRALSDPTRLRLLEFLMDEEHTVTECVAHVSVSQGRVSSHLACLADCGYVDVRRVGRHAFYRVTDPRVAEIIRAARTFAADNAAGLARCTRVERQRPA